MEDYPIEAIRNFCIIAHIDHGKSTLADRLLELTGAISTQSKNQQVLDKLEVERQRGITVKAQTASIFYTHENRPYCLNLIDTPGHVDFSYEVSRSLSACQGALLLVDAVQGIQAQTVANYWLAKQEELTILPIMNKIDSKDADVHGVLAQLESTLQFESTMVKLISAKMGTHVDELLPAIIQSLPPPPGSRTKPTRLLLFDSWYDTYRGVICLFSVIDGSIEKGQKLVSMATKRSYEILDMGILCPEEHPCPYL